MALVGLAGGGHALGQPLLSGMAEGTDIFCSEIVLALREKNPAIKLHCILPCTAQAEKWSVSSQELYRSILGRADSVVYVSRDYHEKCMLDRYSGITPA